VIYATVIPLPKPDKVVDNTLIDYVQVSVTSNPFPTTVTSIQ